MVDNAQVALHRPRLNPFAFPSDTDLRFILLIVCVLGACLWTYDSALWQNQRDFVRHINAELNCAKSNHLTDLFGRAASGNDTAVARYDAAHQAYVQCLAPLALSEVVRMLSGLVLLLSVAGVMYLAYPSWKRWRKRLVPLPVDDVPEVGAELVFLCREAGLARQPQFVWNPLNPMSEGLAFGRTGRYFIALTGGLVKQFYSDRPAFRAIMRHELAHLRNADVDKTYFSVVVWWAFVITAMAPFGVYLGIKLITSALDAENLVFYMNLIGRVLALTVLVWLMRNAVLRARELYADVRASTCDGPTGALNRVLGYFPHAGRSRHWEMLQTHPNPETRQATLSDTRSLFQLGFWDAFGTGIAAAITFESAVNLFTSLTESLQSSFPSSVAAGLIFGTLAAGVVGAGLWRATFAALTQGRTPRGTGWLALGVMLGIVVGQSISLSLLGADLPAFNTLGSFLAVWGVWCALLWISLLLVLRWIVAAASVWLEVTASRSTLRLSSRLGLLIAGGFWALCFGLLFQVGSTVISGAPGFSDIVSLLDIIWVSLTVLVEPLVFVGLISLWAFPLAAWLWCKLGATSAASDWAWLDSPPQQGTLLRQEPFHLRLALLTGIVGSLLFCMLVLALRFWLRLTVPEAIRTAASFKLALWYWSNSRAVLIQVGVAIVTAAWARRLGGLQGLFAAFVAGCLMAASILGVNLLFGGTINPFFVWNILSSIVIPGGLLALLTASVVSVLAKWAGSALRTGVVGGLIYCGLILSITIGWRFLTHESINAFSLGEIVLIVLFQIMVGAVVAARSRLWSWLHGLFAAFVTGLVGSISIPLSTTSSLASFENDIAYIFACIYIATLGLLLALPIVLVVSVVAGRIQRARRRESAEVLTTTSSPTG